MVEKIYWTSIEYLIKNNPNTKGGMIYAFVQAIDARAAIRQFEEKLLEVKKDSSILEVEFVSPYTLDIQWSCEKEKIHFDALYHSAFKSKDVIWDSFYDYGFED